MISELKLEEDLGSNPSHPKMGARDPPYKGLSSEGECWNNMRSN